MAASPSILSLQSVSKTFPGVRALADVSFDLYPGQVTALIGENGAGKSTIVKILTGIYTPDEGRVSVEGRVCNFPSPRDSWRAGIVAIHQETVMFDELTVAENIFTGHMPVNGLGLIDWNTVNQKSADLLKRIDADFAPDMKVKQLSVAQKHMVEIARALASQPHFMLLDEPLAGIDPIAVGDIQDLVRHLKARGIGVLITDHSVRETLGLTDRAYIIYSGHVLTEGPPEEIVANPDVRRIYLGEDFKM